jgi:hypothetical protein
MERIKDGRRDITIHGGAAKEDVPVTEFPDDARVAGADEFVPANMQEPTLYPGDVVVGVYDGDIGFAELIYEKLDGSVMVDPLEDGTITVMDDQLFSRRFYQADEIHVYGDVVSEKPEREGVEFDETKIERVATSRTR